MVRLVNRCHRDPGSLESYVPHVQIKHPAEISVIGPVVERIRLFVIESPIKMARLQCVGSRGRRSKVVALQPLVAAAQAFHGGEQDY
jgi:hypothetical protein